MAPGQREIYRARRRRYKRSAKGMTARRAERRRATRRKQNSAAGRREIREQIYRVLGNRCRRCGFTDPRAFQIDHVAGDGHIERRRSYIRKRTTSYFRRVLRSVVANEGRYQLLCANCNWIKAYSEDVVSRNGAVTSATTQPDLLPLFAGLEG